MAHPHAHMCTCNACAHEHTHTHTKKERKNKHPVRKLQKLQDCPAELMVFREVCKIEAFFECRIILDCVGNKSPFVVAPKQLSGPGRRRVILHVNKRECGKEALFPLGFPQAEVVASEFDPESSVQDQKGL